MKTKFNAFLLSIALQLQSVAYAGFDEGVSAFLKGDYQTSFKELNPLAGKGNADAQYYLANMYFDGKGVTQDYKQAVSLFRKAAEQEHVGAQTLLAIMYFDGKGVTQDYKQAFHWYKKAAELGEEKAQYNLGVMYSKGQGVTQDYVMTHKWFNIAGANGDAEAAKSRNIVEKLMTPQQIAKAQDLAREWMQKHEK